MDSLSTMTENSAKSETIYGLKWTTFSYVILTITQILKLSILARFLNARDFGLMAVMGTFINFSNLYLDLGLSKAIIQKRNATTCQLSTLYWLNILAGVFFYSVIALLASPIAAFYHAEELKILIPLVSLVLLIQPFGQMFRMILQRELRFRSLAVLDIFSGLTTFFLAVFLAFQGWGVMTLVVESITLSLLSTMFAIYLGLRYHNQFHHFDIRGIREMLTFGAWELGAQTVWFLSSQVDVFLFGRFFGIAVLGEYNLARGICARLGTIVSILARVSFPVMSSLQENERKLEHYVLQLLNYLCSSYFFLGFLAIGLAEPIVAILYGPQYPQAATFLQLIIIIQMLAYAPVSPLAILALSRGRPDLNFYYNLFLFIQNSLITIVFYPDGIHAVLTWMIVNQALFVPIAWRLVLHPVMEVSVMLYFRKISRPLILALAAFSISAIALWTPIPQEAKWGVFMILYPAVSWLLIGRYNRSFTELIHDLLARVVQKGTRSGDPC